MSSTPRADGVSREVGKPKTEERDLGVSGGTVRCEPPEHAASRQSWAELLFVGGEPAEPTCPAQDGPPWCCCPVPSGAQQWDGLCPRMLWQRSLPQASPGRCSPHLTQLPRRVGQVTGVHAACRPRTKEGESIVVPAEPGQFPKPRGRGTVEGAPGASSCRAEGDQGDR